eukprot:scaffold12427_cov51-Cyclotella_meneghiniana.AAC.4
MVITSTGLSMLIKVNSFVVERRLLLKLLCMDITVDVVVPGVASFILPPAIFASPIAETVGRNSHAAVLSRYL